MAVFLDYMSTTPVCQSAIAAMKKILSSDDLYGNPSSMNHCLGNKSRQLIENCRIKMLQDLALEATHKLYFTSGATESINIALLGSASFYKSSLSKVIYCATDHKAVIETVTAIDKVTKHVICPVNKKGIIDLNFLESELIQGISLVNLTIINNEIGTIQPIDDVVDLCKRYGAIIHVDAAQMIGKIPVPSQALKEVDYISLSAHKFYGPKGVGALLIKKGRRLSSPVHGGGQEEGIRPGTYATHQIAGMQAALSDTLRYFKVRLTHVEKLHTLAMSYITSNNLKINSFGVPHNLNFTLPEGTNMDVLDHRLKEYCYSRGSACQTLQASPSHVLLALGHELDYISRTIRVSLSHRVSEDQLQGFFLKLIQSV